MAELNGSLLTAEQMRGTECPTLISGQRVYALRSHGNGTNGAALLILKFQEAERQSS